MFKYETHLHTWPVSKCGSAGVRESLAFYKSRGYDGVFVTNHFLDGNLNMTGDCPYEERLRFYLADYKEAKSMSAEIGIKVFFGVELSYHGTDFLIYGLPPEWYFDHPEIMEMKKSAELLFLRENGALVIQAHPFRNRPNYDHIRLFPNQVEGMEVVNASEPDSSNRLAEAVAHEYKLFRTAGSDNHSGPRAKALAGVETETPIIDEADFIERVRSNAVFLFRDLLYDENKTAL